MVVIQQAGKKIDIGRIIGGIAWPGEKPGFAVVVGEELFPAIGSKTYHCHLFTTVEEQDKGRLIEKCAELAAYFKVIGFYGRYDKTNMRYLDQWNRISRERRLPGFFVYNAPYSESGLIEYHINILQDRLRIGQKTLHGLENSKLPGCLNEIQPDMIPTATDSQFPAVAALGYAVSLLTEYPPRIEEDEEIDVWSGRDSVTGY